MSIELFLLAILFVNIFVKQFLHNFWINNEDQIDKYDTLDFKIN